MLHHNARHALRGRLSGVWRARLVLIEYAERLI